MAKLRDLAHRVQLGPSTASIVAAAKARGIPSRRLNAGSLVQLGQGAKQRRILTAETDRTGAIAELIAQDKDLTRTLLRNVGVPVPEGRPVADAEDAWEAAQEIGAPVVVKPRFGNQGRGVATNLTTREQVMAAYDTPARRGTRSSSSGSPPATTTACWSSATASSPPRAASRRRSSATAVGRSPSWSRRSTATPGAATIMRRR